MKIIILEIMSKLANTQSIILKRLYLKNEWYKIEQIVCNIIIYKYHAGNSNLKAKYIGIQFIK